MVRAAYEFVVTLYAGHFQADGKPFVAHSVGVASILAQMNMPAEVLAVGLLHNVYGNADFGDGRTGPTAARRRRMRHVVGEAIEQQVHRFRQYRVNARTAPKLMARMEELDESERQLVLVDLADHLEKYVDDALLYYGDNAWVFNATDKCGPMMIELAERLGQPELAGALKESFERAVRRRDQVPSVLRTSDGRRYLKLFVPHSCRRRWVLVWREWLSAGWRQVRPLLKPRTRWRQAKSAAAHVLRIGASSSVPHRDGERAATRHRT